MVDKSKLTDGYLLYFNKASANFTLPNNLYLEIQGIV